MLLKWQVKKLGFQRLWDLLSSGMQKKVFGTFYPTTIRSGKKRKKSVGRMSEKLEMTSNYSFFKNVSLNPRSVNDSHQRCSVGKVVLTKACNVIKKEPLAQVFSCEFCEISKNIVHFYRTPPDDRFWNERYGGLRGIFKTQSII